MYGQYIPSRQELLTQRNRQYVKEFLGRPFTLVTAIVILASALLGMIVSFVEFGAGLATILDNLNNWIQDSASSDAPNISFSANVNISVPTLALVLSLILMYIKSKREDCNSTPTVGVTIFWVWSILTLVSDIATAAALLIIPLLIVITISVASSAGAPLDIGGAFSLYTSNDRFLTMSIVLVCVVLTGMMALFILRGISRFRFATSLRKSSTSDTLSAKGSVLYAIINIYYAVFLLQNTLVLSIHSLMFDQYAIARNTEWGRMLAELPLETLGITTAIGGILSALTPIFMAKFALRYRKHIKVAGENGCNLPATFIPVATTPHFHESKTEATPESSNSYIECSVSDSEEVITENSDTDEDTIIIETDAKATDNTGPAEETEDVTEESTPVAESPVIDSPVTEVPVTETSVAETPATEAPVQNNAENENPYADFLAPAPATPVAHVYNAPISETPVSVAAEAPATEKTMAKFCSQCGSSIKPEQNFCAGCGTKLN